MKCDCDYASAQKTIYGDWICRNCGHFMKTRKWRHRWLSFFIGIMFGATVALLTLYLAGCGTVDPIVANNVITAPPPAPANACDDIMTICAECPRDIVVVGARMTFRLCVPETTFVEMWFTDRCYNPTPILIESPDVIEVGFPMTYSAIIPDDAGTVSILVIDAAGAGSVFPCVWIRP